ncbi:MAG TPA: 6-carboxytetrahydropterin synthase [Caldimonas sp.]|nr:6-carboxytetrahydropterin synthase [Caldimonas sp.]HEX2541082.1 6-carboxytetrahydropterin synthase [Caldimonas sp.]
MKPLCLTVATAGFEAARHVDLLPDGHRCRNVHGHSFQASVFTELRSDWAPFPGGEVSELRRRMDRVLAPLNYADLNATINQPTDENIARWIRARLALPGIDRIAIQSTANHGVDLDRDGMAHVWRRYKFQAAHRLPNVALGHKCGRMHGHGFEVIVHANQDLGSRPLSIDYDHLDEIWAPLNIELNYKCLNEIEGLDNPTSEILSSWLWKRVKPVLPELSWVTVFETGACGANFDGESYRIWKDFTMDSAVQLRRAPPEAPESGVHGHTFRLRLHIDAPLDTLMGWTIDFGDVKTLFDPVFKALDHQPLHEIRGLRDTDTASVAEWIYQTTKADLPQLVRVDLFETEGCGSIVAQDVEGPALPV